MDVTHATMCRWTTRGHERMQLPNAKPRDAHFEGRLLHDDACRAWLACFIDHWLKPAEQPVQPRANGPRRQRRAVESSVSTR
jgi:GMP synthase (glutamine-hydrolysing)